MHSKALSQNRLLIGLDASVVAAVCAQVKITQISPGQVIIHDGDTDREVYFLLSGTVIGQMVSETGREMVFTEMHKGTFFGELAALDGRARSVTISAKNNTILASLSGTEFMALLNAQAGLAINLSVELARRIRVMNERTFGLIIHDVSTRLRLHLMRLAQEQGKLVDGALLESVPTHEEMATYVGATREAVSRAMTSLNKSGLIAASRQRILIKDCNGLLDGLVLLDGYDGLA